MAEQRQSMRDTPLRVFLSHTTELRAYPRKGSFVDAAESAVIRARHAVIDMAYFHARDTKPPEACIAELSRADVYVGIIGHRYGNVVPDTNGLSYTEFEFQTAGEFGLPRLIFLVDGAFGDAEPESRADRQRLFRQRLLSESDLTVARVRTPQDLAVGLIEALHDLLQTRRVGIDTQLPNAIPAEPSSATKTTAGGRFRLPISLVLTLGVALVLIVVSVAATLALNNSTRNPTGSTGGRFGETSTLPQSDTRESAVPTTALFTCKNAAAKVFPPDRVAAMPLDHTARPLVVGSVARSRKELTGSYILVIDTPPLGQVCFSYNGANDSFSIDDVIDRSGIDKRLQNPPRKGAVTTANFDFQNNYLDLSLTTEMQGGTYAMVVSVRLS